MQGMKITLYLDINNKEYAKSTSVDPGITEWNELMNIMESMTKTTLRTFLKLKGISEEEFFRDKYFVPSQIIKR